MSYGLNPKPGLLGQDIYFQDLSIFHKKYEFFPVHLLTENINDLFFQYSIEHHYPEFSRKFLQPRFPLPGFFLQYDPAQIYL